MTTSLTWLVLPLALSALGLAGTAGMAQAASTTAVQCDVRVTDAGGERTLEAVIKTAQPLTGSYQLDVSTSGGGNSSSTSQSDDFSVGAGETVLSSTSFNAGSYAATLEVTWGGGSVSCKRSG